MQALYRWWVSGAVARLVQWKGLKGEFMEPQNQVPPTDQPPTIGGEQTPAVSPQADGRKRKWLTAVAGVVVLVLLGLIWWLLAGNGSNGENQNKQPVQQATNPDYGNIKVGNFRYVNACQALSAVDENAVFPSVSTSATFSATYAEHTLPTEALSAGSGKVTASCTRSFDAASTYGDSVVNFSIDQYPTTKAANDMWSSLTVSQADLDKANQRFGGDLRTNTVPLDGAANSVYDPTSNTSYTLDGNKIISFSGLLAKVSADTFKQNVVAALPKVLTNVHSSSLKQQFNTDPVFGTKLGAATYYNPCQFFGADDYKAITGMANDPTAVRVDYQYRATTDTFSDIRNGAANNMCTRRAYPGSAASENVQLQLDYFETTADAAQTIRGNYTRFGSEDGQKVQEVPGVGSYAYYRTQDSITDMSYLDVQKGPYILELVIHKNSKAATPAQASQAAGIMLKKLPS